MIDYYEPKLDLTLLGCGFLGSYHLGAIYLLSQIWPHKPYNRICGASCGGLLGALVISGLKLDHVLVNAMDILRQLRCWLKNPTQISYAPTIGELVERSLERLLPANAHELCTDRLGVSVTKVWSLKNKFISKFNSRRDLIDAICAGCFIPIWSGALVGPQINGEHFIDGAYSNNSPKFVRENGDAYSESQSRRTLGTYRRLELSPFATDIEISPKNEPYLFKSRVLGTVYLANWNNIVRTCHAMFPFRIGTYMPYLHSGYQNMKDYLFENDLIKCRECYQNGHDANEIDHSVMSCGTLPSIENQSIGNECDSIIIAKKTEFRRQNRGRACIFCLRLLERVDSLRVPDEMLRAFFE